MQKAIDEAYAASLLGQNILGKDFNLDVYHPPRRRRLHLRRGDRADREPGRQARLAAHQAAVPGRRGRLPQADRRQQHRDAGLRDAHRRSRRRLVQVDRRAARPEEPARRRQLRAEALLHQRPRQQALLRRVAAGRHGARADRQARRRRLEGPQGQGLHPRRHQHGPHDRGGVRHAARFQRPRQGRLPRPGHRGGDGLRRDRPASSMCCTTSVGSSPTSRAASVRRAARGPAGCSRSSTACGAARAGWRI